MNREPLDIYDELPEDMIEYLRYNGRHFSRKLCDYAVSQMTTKDENGKEKPIDSLTKSEVENILSKYGIRIENDILYDKVFVANMCKADYLGSSIKDEESLGLYIKDVLDDIDGYDGIAFNRWYADVCRKGLPIDWYGLR